MSHQSELCVTPWYFLICVIFWIRRINATTMTTENYKSMWFAVLEEKVSLEDLIICQHSLENYVNERNWTKREHLSGQFLSLSCSCPEKNCQIISWRYRLWGWRFPGGKSRIRHWYFTEQRHENLENLSTEFCWTYNEDDTVPFALLWQSPLE